MACQSSLLRMISAGKLYRSPSTFGRLKTCSKIVFSCSQTQVRNLADRPEGYQFPFMTEEELPEILVPGSPLTPERRAQLAAKYNLRPEDYVPRTEMGYHGDYPQLPIEGVNERDPWYDWDMKYLRRNFGEPVMHDIDDYDQFSMLDRKPLMVDRSAYRKFWLILTVGFSIFLYIGSKFPTHRPMLPRQLPEVYPRDDKKNFLVFGDITEDRYRVEHYSFEK